MLETNPLGVAMRQISHFNGFKGTKKTADYTLEQLLSFIRSGNFLIDRKENLTSGEQVATVRLRKAEYIANPNDDTKKALADAKGKLPAFTISLWCASGRKDIVNDPEKWRHTGLCQLDVDSKDHPEMDIAQKMLELMADPCIYGVGVSPSGDGIKGIFQFPADIDGHSKNYIIAQRYFLEVHGIKIDNSCKDANRIMYLPYDPNFMWKDDVVCISSLEKWSQIASQIELEKAEQKKKQQEGEEKERVAASNAEIESCIVQIEERKINIAPDFETWKNIALALISELGADGEDAFIRVSQFYPEFSSDACRIKYKEFLTWKGNQDPITIATFYFHCQKFGIYPQRAENQEILLSKEYIMNRWNIRYNTVTGSPEYKWIGDKQWKQVNDSDLYIRLREHGIEISKSDVKELLASSFLPEYDPIRDYFHSLKGKWNTSMPDYISELCSRLKLTDPSKQRKLELHFRKHIIRMVAQALSPRAVNKQCFVIKSTIQNIGKTTFIRNLVPAALSEFYTENPDFSNKDGKYTTCENFLINCDELQNLHKSELNNVKTTLSLSGVKERRPYAGRPAMEARRASFWATTNDDSFIPSDTGTVRWIAFDVCDIDWTPVDMDMVWAQAYHLHTEYGATGQLAKEEIAENEEENIQYVKMSSEEEAIRKFLNVGEFFYTATEITDFLGHQFEKVKFTPVGIGRALAKCGFKKQRKLLGDKMVWGYYLKALYPEK